jgi:hypothetical protein
MFSFKTNEQTGGNPVASCMLLRLVERQSGKQPVRRHCCLLFVVYASAGYNKTPAYTALCPVNIRAWSESRAAETVKMLPSISVKSYFSVLHLEGKGKIIPFAGRERIWGHCR